MKAYKPLILTASLMILMLTVFTGVSYAHQPYCEEADLTLNNAWQVPDSAVSYAYYGNVYPGNDADYFSFEASAGQRVLISLSIPDIEGQEDYNPSIAVFGPGIDSQVELPASITVPDAEGSMIVPLGDESEYWFEPFGRRYYYNYPNYFFEAPQDATYTAVLWHPEERIGRYSFVLGQREEFGGDFGCMMAMDDFWTPLVEGESPHPEETMVMDSSTHTHADGEMHDHSKLIDLDAGDAPVVDLSVIPLSDGSYNVRVQTLNFTFAPQKIDQAPTDGEGHAHLYVDGVKIARIYGEWYHLASLPEDAQEISVTLYANNHQALAVDGVEISDSVQVAELLASSE